MRQLKITNKITNLESTALEKYLKDIKNEELLTPDNEVKIAKRAREGDEDAIEQLTKGNLRFVVSVAKQYQNQGLSLSDLINEGNLGLIKAAQRFDETKGFKFISYAVWRIRQSIISALAEQARIVRVPLNKVGSLNKINKAQSELEQQYEREPTNEELAVLLEMSPDEVEKTLGVSTRHVSLDAPILEGEDHSLLDVLTKENDTGDHFQNESLRIDLASVLSTLNIREQIAIEHYYGLNGKDTMSSDEIGLMFHIGKGESRTNYRAFHKKIT